MILVNFILKAGRIARPGIVLGVCLLYPVGRQDAQTRRSPRIVTSITDVVRATQFSPDGKTLAIARGTSRSGRVELWDVETGASKHVIKGFDGPVGSVSFSPDGKVMVTGSSEYRTNKLKDELNRRNRKRSVELKWWNVDTGELTQQMEVPGAEKVSVIASYSPDGKRLATIEYSFQVALTSSMYESSAGQAVPFFPRPVLRMFDAYKADLRLRDAQTGEVTLKLKSGMTSDGYGDYRNYSMPSDEMQFVFRRRLTALTFSPDGLVVAGWTLSELRLWNCLSGEEVGKLKDFKGRLSTAAFSPDGRFLAAGITQVSTRNDQRLFRSRVLIYDMASRETVKVLPVETAAISSLAFSRNGAQLLIGGSRFEEDGSKGTVELVGIREGSLGRAYVDEDGGVQSLTLSPNARVVAVQTNASTVKLLDTLTWKVTRTFDDSSDPDSAKELARSRILSLQSVPVVAFSSDGKTVTGGIDQGGVRLWDVRTGEVKRELSGDEDEDSGSMMAISANGMTVGEVGADDALRLSNLTSAERKTVPIAAGSVSALALSPDGTTLAVRYPNQVVLLNTATGQQIQTLNRPQSKAATINCLVFSSDGRALANSEDSQVEIWDLTTSKIRRAFASSGNVTALSFAPDGRTLASSSQDGSVSIWDLQTGSLILQLKKHTAAVNAIAFSTAGDLIASGGDDRSVIIWETATGKARRTLKGHDLTVTSLAFSPDASLLASGSGNASVVLWDARNGKLNRVLR
jgi:WD40 repeat protein